MKITLRPYAKDKSRWQVDIRLMNPTTPNQGELRRRVVAPPGCDRKRARAWGEKRAAEILCELMGTPAEVDEPGVSRKEVHKPRTQPRRKPLTLREFFRKRFEPEHVSLLKPSTRVYYAKVWRLYIEPQLGDIPLVAIDDDRVSAFRAALRRRIAATTANMVLAKLAKMLRIARRLRLIESLPHFERLPEPRKRPKEVLSDEQIGALVTAARRRGTMELVIVLLALDAGLRVSEICALKWQDLDLRVGSVLVQRTLYDGEELTPKGTIGKLALTSALRDALVVHRQHAEHGPFVLYRCSNHTGGVRAPHSEGSIWYVLNKLQRDAGLGKSGPHLLRHTMLTRLANMGASVYVVQAVARHQHLSTTQAYLHTQQTGLSREAASLLDQAAAHASAGNALATLATKP